MSKIGLIIAMDCEKQALMGMFGKYTEETIHGKVFTLCCSDRSRDCSCRC